MHECLAYKQTPGNSSQTAAPSAAPTTASTAAPTTTTASVACVNCTTDAGEVVTSCCRCRVRCALCAGKACQFPFSYGGVEYTSCTADHDTAPWCATKVDTDGAMIAGQQRS